VKDPTILQVTNRRWKFKHT